MAEKTAPKSNDPQKNGSEENKTATQVRIEEYCVSLMDKVKVAESEAATQLTLFDSSVKMKDGAVRCYEWTKAGYEKFKLLNIGAADVEGEEKSAARPPSRKAYYEELGGGEKPNPADQEGKEKKEKEKEPEYECGETGRPNGAAATEQEAKDSFALICTLMDVNKKSVNDKLNATMTSLKTLGDKVKAVNEAFCKVEAELGNNCNSADLNVLKNEVKLTEEDPCGRPNEDTSGNPNKSNTDFDKWIDRLCTDVKMAVYEVNEKIDQGVQVASINATVDLNNLKTKGQDMSTCIGQLKTNVDTCQGFFEEKTKAECDNVKTQSVSVTTHWYATQEKKLKLQGLYAACKDLGKHSCACSWEDFRKSVKSLISQEVA